MALGFTGRCKESSNESHYMLAIKCDTFLQSPLGGTASCPQPTEWDRPPNTQKNAEIKEVACEFLVFASCMWISLAPPQSGLFSAGEERMGLGEISAPSAKFYLYASLGIIDAVQVFKNHYTAFHWKKKHKAYDGNSALHTFSTKNQNLASRHIGCAVHQHGMVAQKHQWTIARD